MHYKYYKHYKQYFYACIFMVYVAQAQLAVAQDNQSRYYQNGVDALQQKDHELALQSLNPCVLADVDVKQAITAECWWEKGWAHWLAGDWQETVDAWEVVARANPHRDDLSTYLAQARDNLQLQQQLRQTDTVPSFASEHSETTTLRIRAVGDIMIATDFPTGHLPPSGQKSFGDVVPWLRDADLTFGNLEGTICSQGTTTKCRSDAPAGSCYAFRTPPRYLQRYVDAGFDVMSTANNHALDFGASCRQETEQLLDSVGIDHSGRPGDIASMLVNGLRLAIIGFHSSPSSHYLNDDKIATALVKKLTTNHDIVIVSFHGGAEGLKALHVPHSAEYYYGENRGNLRHFTHLVVDAGADLVIGHGPHVMRAMEIYKGRLIAYSLGNFATYDRFNLSGILAIGAVLEVKMAHDGRFLGGTILPTRQKHGGVPYKDTRKEAIYLVDSLSREDFPITGVRVAQDGTIALPETLPEQ